jgi:hypothetical protein
MILKSKIWSSEIVSMVLQGEDGPTRVSITTVSPLSRMSAKLPPFIIRRVGELPAHFTNFTTTGSGYPLLPQVIFFSFGRRWQVAIMTLNAKVLPFLKSSSIKNRTFPSVRPLSFLFPNKPCIIKLYIRESTAFPFPASLGTVSSHAGLVWSWQCRWLRVHSGLWSHRPYRGSAWLFQIQFSRFFPR